MYPFSVVYKVCNQRAFIHSQWWWWWWWWCTTPLGNPVGNWHGFYTADRITHGHDFSFPRMGMELIFALKISFGPRSELILILLAGEGGILLSVGDNFFRLWLGRI